MLFFSAVNLRAQWLALFNRQDAASHFLSGVDWLGPVVCILLSPKYHTKFRVFFCVELALWYYYNQFLMTGLHFSQWKLRDYNCCFSDSDYFHIEFSKFSKFLQIFQISLKIFRKFRKISLNLLHTWWTIFG